MSDTPEAPPEEVLRPLARWIGKEVDAAVRQSLDDLAEQRRAYDLPSAAKELSIGLITIRRIINDGEIATIQIAGKTRVTAQALDDYVAMLRAGKVRRRKPVPLEERWSENLYPWRPVLPPLPWWPTRPCWTTPMAYPDRAPQRSW